MAITIRPEVRPHRDTAQCTPACLLHPTMHSRWTRTVARSWRHHKSLDQHYSKEAPFKVSEPQKHHTHCSLCSSIMLTVFTRVLLAAASANALLHHLIVGTSNGQALYSLEMNDETRTVYYIQARDASGASPSLVLDVRFHR